MLVHVEESGKENTPHLVMIHGAGGSSATWFMQLKGLSKHYHAVAVDLNGHGKTFDRDQEDIVSSYLQDMENVIFPLRKVILAGHSMGGALTQLYALQRPEDIDGIILVGTGARLRVTPMVFDLLDNDFDGYVKAVGKFMFAETTSESVIEASQAEVRKCPVTIIRRDFELCDSFDIMDNVNQITVPTLIIAGENDVMTPPKYAQYLHQQISGSVLKIIKNAGHSVMLEQPSAFNDAIIDWTSSIRDQHNL